MSDRLIFRAEARERTKQNQENIVLPRLASPRAFPYLWILALVLIAVGLMIAFWPVTGWL